jgi:hypothetical protein
LTKTESAREDIKKYKRSKGKAPLIVAKFEFVLCSPIATGRVFMFSKMEALGSVIAVIQIAGSVIDLCGVKNAKKDIDDLPYRKWGVCRTR